MTYIFYNNRQEYARELGKKAFAKHFFGNNNKTNPFFTRSTRLCLCNILQKRLTTSLRFDIIFQVECKHSVLPTILRVVHTTNLNKINFQFSIFNFQFTNSRRSEDGIAPVSGRNHLFHLGKIDKSPNPLKTLTFSALPKS